MSLNISLTQLSKIINPGVSNVSALAEEQPATGITTDTRTLSKGEVFVALRGKKFDGHDFVEMAVEKGAIALITEEQFSETLSKDIPQFQVEDTLEAYQKIARWWRDQFDIPVIAVTGSVGKTTTKELIAAVLSTQGQVLKTQANYNNEIGVPKTLLELEPGHDYVVIEMAMRASGEIALLTQIARPTVGVITNVGTAHIGRLGSEAAIAQAKCELLEEMPDSSIAVLNRDNRRLMEAAAKVWQGQTLTYGLEGGDLSGELIDAQTLKVEGMELPLPLPGLHNALNYLAALAVAKVLEVNLTSLVKGLSVNLPRGRSQRYQLPNDVVILDQTYNAGLESMVAALHLLKDTSGVRHLAVLGTMKELGEQSPQFHRQVGETVKQLDIDHLLVLVDDPEAEAIAVGACGIPTECFATHDDLVKRLKQLVQPGDRLLFKASNSVGLNRVVEQFRSQF
ncbi:MAG: UDP-N-acetylmuramoyl-tripeptide--D-alanyl-D-alanine ligase [Xenococcaceae cyanobacterium]